MSKGWGGRRDGAGRKPNPNKPKTIPATKVPDRRPLAADVTPQAPTVPAEAAKPFDARQLVDALPQIAEMLQASARNRRGTRPGGGAPPVNPFKLPWFPPSAIPKDKKHVMAMDEMPVFADAAAGWVSGSAYAAEGLVFLGYTYLAELAQRPEYRTMAETIADDATRRWIDFDVVGDEKTQKEERAKDPAGYDERMADPDERKKRVVAAGKEDRVKALKDDQERLEVRDRFYWASTFDSWMGRSHLYLQIGDADFDSAQGEMAVPIGNSRDDMSRGKVTPDTPLKYIKTVEPVWTYPLAYNATNPLAPDWYNPQRWYVMGREIHISRLQTFIARQVPDMLKPAYAFGGLSLSQLAKPYVDIWLDTRQSVADLIKSFSVMILQTDLSVQTSPGNATALLARVALFNMLRDNQGLFVTNKNTEDFKNVSAPLSGLHELQAQSQEHMLSVARIPAVKFTGIQPAGLNASSEGEIKVYDDTIEAYQKRALDPNLTRIINFQMLSLWGDIDPEITHRWEQLRQLTDSEKAEQAKKEAERDAVYVEMGAISPAEVRKKIIEDEDSPYAGLDPDDVPEPPVQEPGEGEEDSDDEPGAGRSAAGGGGEGEPSGGGANDAVLPFASDAAFNEADHPRAPDGKFGLSGGGATSKVKPARLTPTEKAYLDSYSGDEFLKLNQKLREGDTSAPAVAKLDSAIEKSTVAPGTRLYRGISRDALKQLIKGDTINAGQVLSDPGFLSTSTDRNIAGMNAIGGVVMEIEVGEGQAGLNMGEISRNQHEKEVLLPRNSKMKVLGLRAPKKPGDPIIVRVSTENR